MRFLRALAISVAFATIIASSGRGQFVSVGDSTVRYDVRYVHRYLPTAPGFQVWNSGVVSGGLLVDGALWVGAILRGDTSVSFGSDSFEASHFFPGTFDDLSDAGIAPQHRSIAAGSELSAGAISLDDVVYHYGSNAWLTDSVIPSSGGALQLPLKVTQSSYYWPVKYARNLILTQFTVTNYGLKRLEGVFLGFFFNGRDRLQQFRYFNGTQGSLVNPTMASPKSGAVTFNNDSFVLWYASADGLPNPATGEFDSTSRVGAAGVIILGPNNPRNRVSYNWWITPGAQLPESLIVNDFGPRRKPGPGETFRDWGRLGTPLSVEDKYYLLANGERDYDQLTTLVDKSSEGWLPPPADADRIVSGVPFTRSLISVGPFQLRGGESVDLTVGIILADSVHLTPLPLSEKFDPYNPESYLEQHVDFSELLTNAVWAQWIYDNPGRDTDGDGYRGEYVLTPAAGRDSSDTIGMDTAWIAGDGIPDFRGVDLPSEPEVRFTPRESEIVLEWNGLLAETTRDFFTGEYDFEGYRVYQGLAPRYEDLQLVSSYDIENYVQFVLLPSEETAGEFVWTVIRKPFTLEEAKAAYGGGNSDWHPLIHSIDNPLFYRDSQFYFAANDWNQSDLTDTMGIHKIYPDAPYPHTLILDSAFTHDTVWIDPVSGDTVSYVGGELTPDGERFKYFEYRMVLRNQLASQRTYLSVTAFDFGAPQARLPGLETNRLATVIEALAQDRVLQNAPGGLHVIVYPNPYRIDGNYREFGFEGRGREDMPDERVREVHFTNLPPVCDIKIYSLDGDMVRQIPHNKAPDDPSAMHESWDVLSRNLQIPVSGIYYWVVETPEGDVQVGKLVLIM